jgi:hypothetical protein
LIGEIFDVFTTTFPLLSFTPHMHSNIILPVPLLTTFIDIFGSPHVVQVLRPDGFVPAVLRLAGFLLAIILSFLLCVLGSLGVPWL